MAAFFKREFQIVGFSVKIESAGVVDREGVRVSRHTLAVMKERGIDMSSHRSRYVGNISLENFDHIYCIDERVKKRLIDFDADSSRIVILNEKNGGIPNPFHRDIEAYEKCASLIETEVKKVIAEFI